MKKGSRHTDFRSLWFPSWQLWGGCADGSPKPRNAKFYGEVQPNRCARAPAAPEAASAEGSGLLDFQGAGNRHRKGHLHCAAFSAKVPRSWDALRAGARLVLFSELVSAVIPPPTNHL
jgi:hypothetical protein